MANMNPYYYLFYRIYIFTNKLGNYDVAYSAVLGLSGLLILNAFILIKIFGLNESNLNLIRPIGFVCASLIILINYYIFIFKRKYFIIAYKYRNESRKSKNINGIIVLFYVFTTFALILFT
jgi:hypothetical protein